MQENPKSMFVLSILDLICDTNFVSFSQVHDLIFVFLNSVHPNYIPNFQTSP